MIRKLPRPDKETWLWVAFIVVLVPVTVSYVLSIWTLIRYLAAAGQAVVGWLASLVG